MTSKEDITRLLSDLKSGKEGAEEVLLPLIYDELHALASYFMRDERASHTLQATALVHEAYLRLSGEQVASIENKAHYMRLAARAMRRVLIDHARRKRSAKKGGGRHQEPLEIAEIFQLDDSVDLIDLDEAMEKLSKVDPDLAQLVELRFFGGLTVEETAKVLSISPRTVKSDWKMAKVWLKNEMGG